MPKKPQDATMRNIRATKKKTDALTDKLADIWKAIRKLKKQVKKLKKGK